jgi:imidazole glycerol-phosphate synthase subunit HisF
MLKVRVMPTLLYKQTTLVKGIGFDSWRRVGSLMQAIKVYNMRQVDELVFFDISATMEEREPDYALVDEFADECFMPLAVGGGIRTVEQVRHLLAVGADKVVINTIAIENPEIITEISRAFGAQCVVVSIDYRLGADGRRIAYTHSGTRKTDFEIQELASMVERKGAGEILLTNIERDGLMRGYDLEGIRSVSSKTRIPVIASGGAGNYEDMYKALVEGGASAIGAASMFHFTEQTPLEAKRYLAEKGLRTRL